MAVLGRCVSVYLYFISRVHILKFVFIFHAVSAADSVLVVFLRLFGHFPNTNSADVVFAARTDQHGVEVHETDWAAVLVDVRLVWVIGLHPFNLFFADVCLDAHFVASAHLIQIYWNLLWLVFFLDLVYGNLFFLTDITYIHWYLRVWSAQWAVRSTPSTHLAPT